MGKIKFLVMDVDGTLTDGKIYMGQNGELFKAFDIKDGYGIHDILPSLGIVPVIITARESQIVANRCRELGVIEFYQGRRDKLVVLKEVLNKYAQLDKEDYTLSNVAYMGDDILDLQCMIPINESRGIAACPIDAVGEVLNMATYVCTHKGGDGAIRELINTLSQL